MAVAETSRAFGDPVRLEMVKRLSGGKPYTTSKVSSELGISRQRARKHLQVLVNARLITLEPKGRDVLFRVEPMVLRQAKMFITDLELQWDQRLDALRRVVEDAQ